MAEQGKLSDMPEGLDRADLGRLQNFAERVVEHGALEILALRAQLRPREADWNSYAQALIDHKHLSPDAIDFLGKELLQDMFELTPYTAIADMVEVLSRHYEGGTPLPPKLLRIEEFTELVTTWKALSDISQFCKTFATKTVAEGDPRYIVACVESALNRNALGAVWRKVAIEFEPEDPRVSAAGVIIIRPLVTTPDHPAWRPPLRSDRGAPHA